MDRLTQLRAGVARRLGMELRLEDPPAAAALNGLVQARDRAGELNDDERAFMAFAVPKLFQSRAQLLQDLFVLFVLGEKREGYFVEFGATDGVGLSNSCLLETGYGWTGILAEPAVIWHEALAAARNCVIDHRCVTDRTGDRVPFRQTGWAELSTIDAFAGGDHHARARRGGVRYDVDTVSLTDLLREHGAPARFDYLSVDTEGSELAILAAHDFAGFRPRIITVEHNHAGRREGLHALLTERGYRRRFEDFSQFDDWYVDLA